MKKSKKDVIDAKVESNAHLYVLKQEDGLQYTNNKNQEFQKLPDMNTLIVTSQGILNILIRLLNVNLLCYDLFIKIK